MKNIFKKFLVCLSFVSFLIILSSLYLIGAKANTDDSLGISQQQLSQLQANMASEVSHMGLTQKRGILGTVLSVSNTQIALVDINGNKRFIDLDALTKFSSPSKTSFGVSDLTKGESLGALGIYNKNTQRILARFITDTSIPIIFHGTISSLDHKNYVAYISTQSEKNIYLDYQVYTKTLSYTQSSNLIQVGWAQLKIGEHTIIIATPEQTKGHFNDDTTILFPNIPSDPKILQNQPMSSASASSKNK